MLKVILNVWCSEMGLEAVKAPLSLVTVWGASLTFVQTTCVPALMVKLAGEKEYFSSFSTIETFATVGVAVGEGVGVGAVVGVAVGAVVAVGVLVVAVDDPPQAVKNSVPMTAKDRIIHRERLRYERDNRETFI